MRIVYLYNSELIQFVNFNTTYDRRSEVVRNERGVDGVVLGVSSPNVYKKNLLNVSVKIIILLIIECYTTTG